MRHLGDFDTSAVIYGKFSTFRPSTGAAYTLGGTPALSVYKDNDVTQSTTGVTLVADFDSVTGLNHFTIDTSTDGTFYAAGSFFDIVITTGTVDSVSVVGSVVGSFTLRKNSSLKPTTAGRTIDVSAGGEAGVDWANVGSPTTAVDLSGTNIKTNQKVDVETIKTQTVTCGAGVTVLASVGTAATSTAQTGDSYALANGANGFVAIKDDTAAILTDTGTTLDTKINNIQGATFDTATDSLEAIRNRGDAAWVTASPPSAASIADAVWDEAIAGHLGAGSTGEALNAAGAAGDPWTTTLPGAYGAGSAGYIIGTNVNATVSSRASQTSVDTIDGIADNILLDTAEIGAAGAGLTNLPWNAAWDAEVQSECTDALNAYDPPTKAEMDTATGAVFTTALTEAYAADGAAFTGAQALYMIWSALSEFAIAGTTITAKKLDGSATAMTFTLDDGTNPTSRTRAT